MRNVPEFVDRVAMKSAAEMIVHSAGGHLCNVNRAISERVLAVSRFRIARVEARKKIERRPGAEISARRRNRLRPIKAARKLLEAASQPRGVDFRRTVRCAALALPQRFNDLCPLLAIFSWSFPGCGDPFEDIRETRADRSDLPAENRCRRKTASAPA